MWAGKLDRKITIEVVTETRDNFGGIVESWATHQEVWSQKIPVRTEQRLQAGRQLSIEAAKWRCRFVAGVNEKMRLKDDVGRIWKITGIAEIGRRAGIDIDAEIVK